MDQESTGCVWSSIRQTHPGRCISADQKDILFVCLKLVHFVIHKSLGDVLLPGSSILSHFLESRTLKAQGPGSSR